VTVTDGDGRKVVRTFAIEAEPDCAGAVSPDDEFGGDALDYCRWNTIVRETPSGYRVKDGALEIDAADGDMYGGTVNARNLILQDAPDGGWEAVTRVKLPQGEEYEQAGLMAHSSDADFAKLVLIDVPNLGWRAEFGQNLDGQAVFDEVLDRSGPLPAGINTDGIWLKLSSTGTSLIAAWSADGETWTPFGRSRPLAPMPDVRIGLTAFNGNGQAAAFDFFHLDEKPVEEPCQTPATPDPGYRMLFDGTPAGLAQWKMAGPGGFALQGDCTILSYGGLGLLYHPDTFSSYSLQLDWKMAGDDNSGVFVGFPDPGNDPNNAINQGQEIQIDATDDPSHTTGSVYGFQAAVESARDAALNPPGEWNHYEIVVVGQRIQVFLNGTKINDYTDTDPARLNAPSLVGVQNHGGGDEVYFRNIEIKELETPSSPAPSLSLSAPADGAVVGGEVTVSGATDGASVLVRAGGRARTVSPSGGAFSVSIPLDLGPNTITATAFNADGVPTTTSVGVISRAYGQLVGGLDDPTGDDDGPGTYVYPTNAVYTPGIFDLQRVEVYSDGDQVRFVTRIAGDITNQFGGDRISHQRVNIYVGGDGDPAAALPGTNMGTETPWSAVVVVDGRFDQAGVYAPDGSRIARGTISTLPAAHEIAFTVPRSAFGDVDLRGARYGVAMFGNAEAGEGIGYVRPVYDLEYWQNPPADKPWIKEYRFGGGAGEWTGDASHDSDTRDPNALDVIVGAGQTQAQVLDWRAGSPTRVPMVRIAAADTTPPVVSAELSPPSGGPYVTPVTVRLSASDDSPGEVAIEYRLDGGDWTVYEHPVNVRADGSHVLGYRATDAAGNVSSPGSVSFVIDKPSEDTRTVAGDVPPTLSLTLGASASFGVFQPSVTRDYVASTTALVTSSAASATLSVSDPGHLMNGSYALADPLQVAFSKSSWAAPVANDSVAITFAQHIDETEGLHAGVYGKTLTFTLSTTTP
jgi:hypothetical protein